MRRLKIGWVYLTEARHMKAAGLWFDISVTCLALARSHLGEIMYPTPTRSWWTLARAASKRLRVIASLSTIIFGSSC